MSTIKSSDEHLTLNADGSSKDIKFQANGVEKASISSAGAFTSTTIDATALTGNLPALNASALTNLDAADVSGTHTNFTSTGIDDNATSTAITIDASENVGIGAAPESGTSSDVSELDMGLMSLSIWKGESQPNDSASYGYNCYKTGGSTYKAKKSSQGGDWRPAVYEQIYGKHIFRVASSGTADSAISWTTAMTIDNSGRVTMPSQPSFSAGISSHSGTGEITNWAINTNIGSHFSSSTGRFTAPVAGKYLISFFGMSNSNQTVDVSCKKNGSDTNQLVPYASSTGNTHVHVAGSSVFDLAANDYVSMFSNGATFYGTSSGRHSQFTGFLIG